MSVPLLDVRDLHVAFDTPDGTIHAVNGLSYTLEAGGTLAIVGESGSGKSQSALALMGLAAGNARVSGSVRFEGRELLTQSAAGWRGIRGQRIGMVFQDPMSCLNPYLDIGTQMAEVLVHHRGLSWRAARGQARDMLDAVRVSDAARRLRQYPHELSGGLRQRVMIATVLLCRPQLLIADEPTTALDVTVQAQLLDLLAQLRQDFGIAILLITHDLGLVAELCRDTLVMYAGQLMEYGRTAQVLDRPTHPYTAALLRSRPRLDEPLSAALPAIAGNPPNLMQLPPGCPFEPRCAYATAECAREPVRPQPGPGGRLRSCRRPAEELKTA